MDRLKDFVNGVGGGWCQVFIMQPFDKVKVQIAIGNYQGIVQCIKSIWNHQRLQGFYRGTMVLLLLIGSVQSTRFGTYQNTRRSLKQILKLNPNQQFPANLNALSGFIGGFTGSFIACPVEHMRIRAQISQLPGKVKYSGSINALFQIIKNHGIKAVWRGLAPTIIRDSTSLMFFLTTLEALTKKLTPPGVSKTQAPIYVPLLSGGLAGIAYWALNYPFDFVKTIMQSDSLTNPKYKGFIDCFSREYKEKGLIGMHKGYTICMLRAFPVNAGFVFGYRLMQRLTKTSVIN